jgi:hypothetical protein
VPTRRCRPGAPFRSSRWLLAASQLGGCHADPLPLAAAALTCAWRAGLQRVAAGSALTAHALLRPLPRPEHQISVT